MSGKRLFAGILAVSAAGLLALVLHAGPPTEKDIGEFLSMRRYVKQVDRQLENENFPTIRTIAENKDILDELKRRVFRCLAETPKAERCRLLSSAMYSATARRRALFTTYRTEWEYSIFLGYFVPVTVEIYNPPPGEND